MTKNDLWHGTRDFSTQTAAKPCKGLLTRFGDTRTGPFRS